MSVQEPAPEERGLNARHVCIGTTYKITSSWSIIHTKTGEIYVEYHGDPYDLGLYDQKNQSCNLLCPIILTLDEPFVWKHLECAVRPILDCPSHHED